VSKASKIIIRSTFVIAASNLNIKHAGSIENYTNTAFTVTNTNLRYKPKGIIGSYVVTISKIRAIISCTP